MTSAQRYWLSGFFLVFALLLAVYHLEWKGSEYNDERLVLPFYNTSYVYVVDQDTPNANDSDGVMHNLKKGDQLEVPIVHGIYIRQTRNVVLGLLFGIILPFVLIGASGFIAFRHTKKEISLMAATKLPRLSG